MHLAGLCDRGTLRSLRLDLDRNVALGDLAAATIATLRWRAVRLETLHLGLEHTSLTDIGVQSLCHLLHLQTLRRFTLHLGSNSLGDAVTQRIIRILLGDDGVNHTLQQLEIDLTNTRCSPGALQTLRECLGHPKLRCECMLRC